MSRALFVFVLTALVNQVSWSDTIANYQRISQSVPKMEIKANEQSQAWARSARHVLNITNESIAETLIAINEEAMKRGRPFFCLQKNQRLDAQRLGQLIEDASKNLNRKSPSSLATVSQIAFEAVLKNYPCQTDSQNALTSLTKTHAAMQHADSSSKNLL